MAFGENVKREALVRSKRCCCICNQFAGLFINVHHIIPEAQGGPDTLDNAIVLCLRCHGEVGHYNPLHPIGNKYSQEELIRHRDEWWKSCKENPHMPLPAEKEVRDYINAFLQDRINKIVKGETPIPLHEMPRIILQINPFEAVAADKKVDLSKAEKEWYLLKTIAGNPTSYRRNADGLLTICEGRDALNTAIQYTGYAQLFGNGIVEVVDEYLLNRPGMHSVPGRTLEQKIGLAYLLISRLLKKLDIELPIFIYLTLSGVKNYTIDLQDESAVLWPDDMRNKYIDRDVVQTSEVAIDSYACEELPILLRPVFNQIWQAAGWHESRNYNITSYSSP